MAKGTFYHHFLTKSAVLLEYGNELLGELLDSVKLSEASDAEPGEAQIRHFFAAVIGFYADHLDGLQLLISHSRSVTARESGFSVAAEELSLWLCILLRNGKQSAAPTFGMEPKLLATYMMRLFYDDLKRIVAESDTHRFRELLHDRTASLLDVWLHGIKK